MQNNDKDKKRSFEEILNDLNSILEKMPNIVDEIKKPIDEKKEEKNNENIIPEVKTDNLKEKEENREDLIQEIKVDEVQKENKEIVFEIKEDNLELNTIGEDSEKKEVSINLPQDFNKTEEEKIEILDPNEILSSDANKETENVVAAKEVISGTDLKKDDFIGEVKKEDLQDVSIKEEPEIKIDFSENMVLENVEIDTSAKGEAGGIRNDFSDQEVASKETQNEENLLDIKFDGDIKIENLKIGPETDQQDYSKTQVNVEFSIELNKLISIEPPKSIDAERIKNVGFVFSFDQDLFLSVLKTIDDICLSSKEKPMFVKRSFVLTYDDSLTSDALIINSKNEKVSAVVLVGELPVEKTYEFENALSQNNIYFVNFKKDNFSKSKAIDFVMELIAR
ncbi:MAG: hypothetical protein AB1602_06045 [Elusimicrobiota bacterium]